MVAQTRSATLADLDATPDDGRIYELLNGEIVVSPAPLWKHQLTSQALNRLLDGWVIERDLGDVMTAPTDVILSSGTTVQSDLFFVASDNPGPLENGRFHGVPELVVEIISPTSQSRDAVAKATRYAAEGVREYWLADPELREITVFELRDAAYASRSPDSDGTISSSVLPGLRVDPAAVFEHIDRAIGRRPTTRPN